MEAIWVILAVIVSFFIWLMCASHARGKELRAAIERRQKYVEAISPTARIIVNNGIHFFFKDDTQQIFGFDESGKTYDFAGLFDVNIYKDCIILRHKDILEICIGREIGKESGTFPLMQPYIDDIAKEVMPILRDNLHNELSKNGITPTHEYEHEGIIWGCDVNSKKFFMTYGCIQFYDFSDLKRVTIEDLTQNKLWDGNYVIVVTVKQEDIWDDFDYTISFQSKDATFNNLLSMFKGIRNRQIR